MNRTFVCLLSVFVIINALPQFRYQGGDVRLKRSSPRATVMFGRYYGRPIKRNSDKEYIPAPQNAMSAFVVGDTVGTSSYVGEVGSYDANVNTVEAADSFESEKTEKVVENNFYYKPPSDDFTTVSPPVPFEVTEVSVGAEEVTTSRQTVNRRPFSISSSKPSSDGKTEENDEEDQSGFWPFRVNNRGQPVYNAFFPISLGGLGGRSRVKAYDGIEEVPSPGAATAIANSFSTGKGGVATSHATSYGDPYLSTLLRSGFNFNKNKNLQGV